MAEQDTKTAPKAAETHKLGDLIKVKPGGVVIRPDNTSHVVIRGGFYLDQVGTFLVDGQRVTVR